MAKEGTEIVDLDVNELLRLLNKALADEWLAYYQYWVGAKVVKGMLRTETIAEMIEHADDELRHANLIADRIIQLGGTPVLEPKKWYEVTGCGYAAPVDPKVKSVLEQNISAEQCAIAFYNNLLKKVEEKDFVTYQMVATILADEVEHEEDLQSLLDDLTAK